MADTLEKTREELERRRALAEIARLEHETHALAAASRWQQLASETVQFAESYDGFSPRYVDPSTPLYDAPGFSSGGEPLNQPLDLEDFRDGQFRPYWSNIQQYFQLQGELRHVANAHEVGRNILDTLLDYVVHQGWEYSIEPADLKDQSEATQTLADEAQRVIDDFHRATEFSCCVEADIVAETIGYGESLTWVRHAGGGRASLERIPVSQIAEPKASYALQLEELAGLPPSSWTYGVVTDPLKYTDVRAFFWDRDHGGANYDVVPASEAVWIKRNVPALVKRGMSDFYPMLGILNLLPPVLRNIVVQTAIQASIAYIRKSTSGVAPQSQGIMPLGSTGSTSVRGANGAMRNIATQIHRPGEIHDTAGVDYHAGPMGDNNAEGFISVYEAALRTVGARWNMPEYLISSVADTANRATAETSETPWIRRVERIQGQFRPGLTRLHERVLGIAARAGLFRAWAIRTIDELFESVSLTVTPPPPLTKDTAEQAKIDVTLVDKHAMSKQTLAERNGLDWDQERQRLEAEHDDEVLNPQPELGGPLGAVPGQDSPTLERTRESLAKLWGDYPGKPPSLLERDCGANAIGGGGFQQGNTCAKGGSKGKGSRVKRPPKPRARRGKTAPAVRKGKTWKMADGGALPEHVAKLRIPPAWKDVQVSTDEASDVLVTGRDEKGRKQTVYSESFAAKTASHKFAKIKELIAKRDSVIDQAKRDASENADAAVAWLVAETGLRPGSTRNTKAAKQAFGATTLLAEHVKDGGKLLEFVGKKGKDLSIPVENSALAKILADRAAKASPGSQIFPEVTDSSLRKYVDSLDGGGFKTKDFRTALGTLAAQQEIARRDAPSSAKSYKIAAREVAKVVASKLGNTHTVALQSYIDPTVFSEWRIDD